MKIFRYTLWVLIVSMFLGCNSSQNNKEQVPINTLLPVITLNGVNLQVLAVGGEYIELGATAKDSENRDLTTSIIIDTSGVRTSVEGTYTVTYDVSDNAGNDATQIIRTVVVTYQDTITSISGPASITKGETVTLKVNYVASQARDLMAYLKTTTGEKTLYYLEKVTVQASNETQQFTFTVPANAPTDEIYEYGTYIAPIGGNFGDALGKAYQQNVHIKSAEVDDTTPPVITLKGETTINLIVGDTYEDAGATANDNKDGNITINIQIDSNVTTEREGTYTVTYNVSDNAGNDATQVTRTIRVSQPDIVITNNNNNIITNGFATTYLHPKDTHTDNDNSKNVLQGIAPFEHNGTMYYVTSQSIADNRYILFNILDENGISKGNKQLGTKNEKIDTHGQDLSIDRIGDSNVYHLYTTGEGRKGVMRFSLDLTNVKLENNDTPIKLNISKDQDFVMTSHQWTTPTLNNIKDQLVIYTKFDNYSEGNNSQIGAIYIYNKSEPYNTTYLNKFFTNPKDTGKHFQGIAMKGNLIYTLHGNNSIETAKKINIYNINDIKPIAETYLLSIPNALKTKFSKWELEGLTFIGNRLFTTINAYDKNDTTVRYKQLVPIF